MDDVDRAQDREQIERDYRIKVAAKEIPPGNPGECDMCGEWSGWLINGNCDPCRDKWGLK